MIFDFIIWVLTSLSTAVAFVGFTFLAIVAFCFLYLRFSFWAEDLDDYYENLGEDGPMSEQVFCMMLKGGYRPDYTEDLSEDVECLTKN